MSRTDIVVVVTVSPSGYTSRDVSFGSDVTQSSRTTRTGGSGGYPVDKRMRPGQPRFEPVNHRFNPDTAQIEYDIY